MENCPHAVAGRSLRWLLDPAECSSFFAEYWEKQPLVVHRRQADYFQDILSLDEVDRVLTTLDRRYPDVTLKNARREISSEAYTRDDGILDVAKVYELFREGATITLAYLDTVLPSLARLCRGLEGEFSCPFQANVYLTPPVAQGAKPHYDTHDVFVLQVLGSKKWFLYGTPVEAPLPGQDFDSTQHPLGDLTREFELHAGDVAYVPRGLMHEAQSTDEVSLHVTVGILRYSWADLLLEYVAAACLKDPAFRKALPPGFARAEFDRKAAHIKLRQLLHDVGEKADFDEALEQFVDQFLSSSPPLLRGQMAQLGMLDNLRLQSQAGARDGAVFRIRSNGDVVSVDCYGRTLSFPSYAEHAVRFALSQGRFAVCDVSAELDDNGKLTLIRRLVREGLVEVLSL